MPGHDPYPMALNPCQLSIDSQNEWLPGVVLFYKFFGVR